MRYIIIIFICISQIAICELKAQTVNQPGLRDYQNSAHELPDSILYIMSTDTSGSREGLGKWRRADSLVNSLGDHDFYGLNTNRPPFIGEDSIETALDTMYVLFKGLDGGLATKIEMLKNGVVSFDKTGLYNTPTYLMSVNPFQTGVNVGRMGMIAYASDNTYGSKKNQVFAFGQNPLDFDNSSTGLYFSFEDYYRPTSGAAYGEVHLVFNDSSDVDHRIWTWFLNRLDPTAWTATYYVDQLAIRDPRALTSDSTYFKIEQVDGNQSQLVLMGANQSVSGGSRGVGQLVHSTNNTFEIYPYGSMPSSSELYTRQFNVTNVNRLRIENDFGTTNGSSGQATSIIGREGSYGGVVGIGSGWGWDLISGALVIDSSQVATQYDLTTISAGATNLSISQSGGTQVIQSSTGTDVGVRNLYGLLITEGATDTLHFRVDSSLIATQYDITQIPISSLKAAAATNTINNANYAQEWQWNTLAGTTGLKLSSTSTAAASNAQKLLEISLSGANASSGQSTYGGYFSNTHTGTTSTNYGLYGVATGGTSNYGLYGTSNSSYTIGTSLGAGVSGRNSNGGIAIEGITTGGGIGVYAESPDGYASYSYTTNGTAAAVRNNWSTNSNYGSVLDIYRNTSNGSNGAAGIGGGIAFYTETSTGATPISNQIKSIWTTATHASRTSSMVFTGLNSGTEGDILTLKGTKQLQFHGYGTGGAFTASPVADLFVDATGNVVQGSMTGQSWLADGDDATAAALISNQTFKITGGSGYTGITTDLFDNAATDSIVIKVNGDKFNTVGTPEADDYVLLHDENGAGADVNEKILWSDLYSLIGTDGNGIYDGSGTVPTSTTATLTDNITLNAGASEADLFIDGTNDLVGIGTNSPEEQLTISNEDSNLSYPIMGFHTDQTASGSAVLGETKYYYGTEDLVRIKAAKQTSAGTNDAELTITMEDASNAAINAVQYDYEENYTFDYPRQRLFGGVQMARVDSLDASTTLDESYYAVRATTSGITITLINANTTNGEFIGMQYIIFNDSGANITINPGGTNDYVNGSNADITLADKAGYMLTLMFTTGFNTNHWVGFKTP